MPIIDPDGLFHGGRLGMCSDLARLHWPYLFCAANGYARIEIDPRRIRTTVYGSFQHPPTEDQIVSIFAEFFSNRLAFIYAHGNQTWAQFETKGHYLKTYKSTKDGTSPAPDETSRMAWLESFKAKVSLFNSLVGLGKSSEICPLGIGVGSGVGVGEGNGKSSCVSAFADDALPFDTLDPIAPAQAGENFEGPLGRKPRHVRRAEPQDFEGFWQLYPRKVDKKPARASYRRARRLHTAEVIESGLRKWIPYWAGDDQKFTPHATTFLNRERFLEDPPERRPHKGNRASTAEERRGWIAEKEAQP